MKANREQLKYRENCRVWIGKYKNSQNMPHWHYDCELIYVENGSLEILCNQSVYTISKGQSFFIDSEEVHYTHALSSEAVVTLIIFDYDLIKPFAEKLSLNSPLLENDYKIHETYDELMTEFNKNDEFYGHMVECKVAELAIEIFRREGTFKKERTAHMSERVKSILTKVEENFEFYTLEEAANDMSMNPAYFSRLFHKLTGITFSQYLNYVKCENAVKLLKDEKNLPVTEISSKCGFITIRNFNRIFKEFTGYTPKSLPADFVMNDSITVLNEKSENPTFRECELLESSDL